MNRTGGEALSTRELAPPYEGPVPKTYRLVGLRPVTVNHGAEFQSRALEDWADRRILPLDFLRPGKPVEHASWNH